MAKKSLGQNFLVDRNVIKSFIKASEISSQDCVIEIGPGTGSLSFGIIPRAGYFIGIEKDNNLAQRLSERISLLKISNALIINNDFLKISNDQILQNIPNNSLNIKVISSLPYNVSKPIIYNLLYEHSWFKIGYFIIQKEVADNYLSKTPHADFLSRIVDLCGECTFLFNIGHKAFRPAPRVESCAIKILKNKNNLIKSVPEQKQFLSFIRCLYNYKRKIIDNSLKMTLKNLKGKNLSLYLTDDIRLKRIEEVNLESLVDIWIKYKKLERF